MQRNIPVIKPSWIVEAYERWLQHEPVDLDATMEAHRVLFFHGLKICTTGIHDGPARVSLERWIEKSGGVHTRDLSQDCTHLVWREPASAKIDKGDGLRSDKVDRAMKWNEQRAKGSVRAPLIHMIWDSWLLESMRLQGWRFAVLL